MRHILCGLAIIVGVLGASDARGQNATFAGTVMIDPTEKPLANAEIVFPELNRSIRSDSAGNFLITGLPAGKHAVTVRMLGYESFTTQITVSGSQKIEADLMLKASTQKLAAINVNDKSVGPYASRLVDFEERRKSGIGKFITGDVFTKEDGRPVSSIISQRLSGVKFIQKEGRRWIAQNRGAEVRLSGVAWGGDKTPGSEAKYLDAPKACYMQVILNGVTRYNGSPGQAPFDIDQLDAKDILGMEVHSVASTPAQYNATQGAAQCGTVIVWTKAG